jgi:chromate transporter
VAFRVDRHPGAGSAKNPVPCARIFLTFLRIGLFTLGGGLAMATVMRHELVHRRRWVEDDDFVAEMATATIVPGAIAVNLAYIQGRRLRGALGAAAAITGTVLPSFLVILAVAWVAMPYLSRPKVAAFFRGCAIGVAAQIAFTAFVFGRRLLRSWRSVVVCAAGLAAVGILRVHPLFALVAAVGLGYWLCPRAGTKGGLTGGEC